MAKKHTKKRVEKKLLTAFAECENGATAIEYGLIAALIALTIIVGGGQAGTAISNLFGDNNLAIQQAFN